MPNVNCSIEMRPKLIISLSLSLLGCLLLWLCSAKNWGKTTLPMERYSGNNEASVLARSQPTSAATLQSSNATLAVKEEAVRAMGVAAVYAKSPTVAKMLSLWQAPIEFYGKVIDEHSNAVAGADVTFRCAEAPSSNGNRSSIATSSTDGLFSLHGQRGPSLQVFISKDGYYSSHGGQWAFTYALGPEPIAPDPQNPVIFKLKEKGERVSLIHFPKGGLRAMADFLLASNGTPTEVSLRTGRLTPAGQGDFRVFFRPGSLVPGFSSRITWDCQVMVPGGGLIETSDEFPFQAPESGYHESDKVTIGNTNWTASVDKLYYVSLHEGTFGRIRLNIRAIPGRAFFGMESFLNPTGSRNLEPNN